MQDNHDNDEKFDNVIDLFGDADSDQIADNEENEESMDDQVESFSLDGLFNEESELEKPLQAASKAKSFLSACIYLKTGNAQILPKIVNEIHSLSGRFACLPFEQMAAQLESVEDIWSLGQITVIVSDVLNLTPMQRELIASYLKRSQSLSDLGPELNDIPLFLISSTTSIESLLQSQTIDVSFAKQITACILEVDRLPIPTMMLKTTLELFLEPGAVL